MINDEDIDTEYPSAQDLSPSDQEEFFVPDNLIANIKLARISGEIINGRNMDGFACTKSQEYIASRSGD